MACGIVCAALVGTGNSPSRRSVHSNPAHCAGGLCDRSPLISCSCLVINRLAPPVYRQPACMQGSAPVPKHTSRRNAQRQAPQRPTLPAPPRAPDRNQHDIQISCTSMVSGFQPRRPALGWRFGRGRRFACGETPSVRAARNLFPRSQGPFSCRPACSGS